MSDELHNGEADMKAFYDNLFFDMDECGLSREAFAMTVSRAIRDDVVEAVYAIKELESRKAIALLQEIIDTY